MRLVQIARGSERRVGVVEEPRLRLLKPTGTSIYVLASAVAAGGRTLESEIQRSLSSDLLDYDEIYEMRSEWRLLPAFDHPADAAHCMVSGTGLTHKASALNRAAMHEHGDAEATDSFKMFRMGLEGGNPGQRKIGVQPEWFFKGDGSILRGHGERLEVPSFASDGGEEPEIVGVYVVGAGGEVFRVGLTAGNEFSDHRMEKVNYLYLAPSKLRTCAIGPELTVDEIEFESVEGKVAITRNGSLIWSKQIWSGQNNMCHSVANLEHHHFKYPAHRRPGDVHIHFFGADAFSFGDGLKLEEDDEMSVSFPQFGRALRNPIAVSKDEEELVGVRTL